jgi:DNA-binding PadR family transcriptional regulator
MSTLRSSVQAAVLGLLVERPGYGYQLAQRFEERVGSAWELTASQIYAALDRLETGGLIEPVPDEENASTTPRQRKVMYRPTEAAPAAFEAWLKGPVRCEPIRAELHVKIATAAPEHATLLLDVLDEHERACMERIEEYRASEPPPRVWRAVTSHVVREATLAHLQADLDWMKRARMTIDELARRERGGI